MLSGYPGAPGRSSMSQGSGGRAGAYYRATLVLLIARSQGPRFGDFITDNKVVTAIDFRILNHTLK